jgi:hypothetical protein
MPQLRGNEPILGLNSQVNDEFPILTSLKDFGQLEGFRSIGEVLS